MFPYLLFTIIALVFAFGLTAPVVKFLNDAATSERLRREDERVHAKVARWVATAEREKEIYGHAIHDPQGEVIDRGDAAGHRKP